MTQNFVFCRNYCCCYLLFNDDHVLQLWSVIIAVHRRMIWWPCDNQGRMWPKIPDICLTVERKILTRKLTRPGTEPVSAAWEVTMQLLDYSSGRHHYEVVVDIYDYHPRGSGLDRQKYLRNLTIPSALDFEEKIQWFSGNVCSNANPVHYYVLRVPRKADRWR